MSSINMKTQAAPIYTGEGARAARIGPLQELIRLTMSCMLWEDNFYIDGKSIAERIGELVHQVTLEQAAGVAIEARNNMKLRHVPLLICRYMANHPKRNGTEHSDSDPRQISNTLAEVIQRPDELSEFLAIYWKDGKCPLSKQIKLGLAKAFTKFNEYQLAKYNRKKDIMLRDVLFLCHSKPADVDAEARRWAKAERQFAADPAFCHIQRPDGFSQGELLYGKLVYDQLQTPDTWEVELSANGNTAEAWLRLLDEKKLGDLAFLRNLRNMLGTGIRADIIAQYGESRQWGRVLPFRFISAARMVPQMEPYLESWMFKCLEGSEMLPGRTLMLCDVSSSMSAKLSGKSDLTRQDAMKALAILLREVCEDVLIVPFAREPLPAVPPRRGFSLADVINRGGYQDGTFVGRSVEWANQRHYDRLIVITDEQSADAVPDPDGRGYMLNVAANRHGIGYGKWLHVDGFSESIVNYIQTYERSL